MSTTQCRWRTRGGRARGHGRESSASRTQTTLPTTPISSRSPLVRTAPRATEARRAGDRRQLLRGARTRASGLRSRRSGTSARRRPSGRRFSRWRRPADAYRSRMDERVEVNRRRWDEMAALHETTYFTGPRALDEDLTPVELGELGDISAQRICHLQSHIGGNSIALARLGATVVGVDFSEVALDLARRRTRDAGFDGRVEFVLATVDDAVEVTGGGFDGVYTSWGVLDWLPSVDTWARVVCGLLVTGGWLYVADTHPHAAALRWSNHRYGGAVGIFDDDQGDYTDLGAQFEHPEQWNWNHGIGEIVTALAGTGMRIEWLHEHTIVAWHLADEQHLVQRSDGQWEVPGSTLPLAFSLRARKE